MAARIIDGVAIAEEMRAESAAQVAAHRAAGGARPRLAVILASDERADRVYAEHKERACDEVGMTSEVVTLPSRARREDLLDQIARWNGDPAVSGILVQTPLPPHIDVFDMMAALDPRKDIDGLSPVNLGLLMRGRALHPPATAAAVLEVLRREGIAAGGARVVIVGRSVLVARPLALLLANKAEGANATVTIADQRSRNLTAIARLADILVAAAGAPRAVTAEMVRPGATVVDTGLHVVARPGRRSRLVGDVDADGARAVAGAITPVPGGIGPVTIAVLLANTLRAARLAWQ